MTNLKRAYEKYKDAFRRYPIEAPKEFQKAHDALIRELDAHIKTGHAENTTLIEKYK